MNDAEIKETGAILLGKNFVCDAHAGRPVRIITHAHADHLLNLEKSLCDCQAVVATPVTKDLIAVLRGKNKAARIKPLNYEHAYEYEGERVTLYPAHHILGSAQVLLETKERKRIVYTGDIRFPPAGIIKADTLIIEATYGNPAYVRKFKQAVESELIKLVKKSLKSAPVYIFGYHGKLQEVVKILNEAGIDIPIVVPEKVFKILKICQAHGMGHRNFYFSKSEEGIKIRKSFHIGLYHFQASRWVGGKAIKIILSGWQFDNPCKKIDRKKYQVALSDHSDFEGLLEYVKKSEPRLVITDGSRAGEAFTLRQEIRKRLGIDAISMP
ncbi:hypothetical protein ES703_88321 [subsurface metagenome]